MVISSILVLTALAAGPLLPASVAAAQEPAQPAPAPQSGSSEDSLERIQKRLMRDPAIKVDKLPLAERGDRGLPTFRVQVDAPKLTIEEILGPDFQRGPVPATGMTHQEFLDLVTPPDVRGYAAFTNAQGITVALTSTALQWALKTALEDLRNARDERARAAARKEVQEAVEALRKARRDAGLPDK